jgi:hypothetical protein
VRILGNTPPKHFNSQLANKELFWCGSDNLSNYKQNIQKAETRKYLNEQGWLHDQTAISYSYNQQGFRSDNFDLSPSYIALGCSFTEGVGLPIEQTWPFLLSKKLSKNIWNLGVGGTGLDTCFRLLDYYINELNILGVFLLTPDTSRFEIHTLNGTICYSPHWDNLNNPGELLIKKLWYSNDDNSYYNKRKNLLAIEQLCYSKGIKLILRESSDLSTTPPSRARDMMHDGYQGHIQVANLFFNDFNKTR